MLCWLLITKSRFALLSSTKLIFYSVFYGKLPCSRCHHVLQLADVDGYTKECRSLLIGYVYLTMSDTTLATVHNKPVSSFDMRLDSLLATRRNRHSMWIQTLLRRWRRHLQSNTAAYTTRSSSIADGALVTIMIAVDQLTLPVTVNMTCVKFISPIEHVSTWEKFCIQLCCVS